MDEDEANPSMTELKPGRELDALVAEKVMWWHKYEDSNPKATIRTIGDTEDHKCKFCGSFEGHDIKPYSTSIEAAWEVVEKLIESDDWVDFSLEYEPTFKWSANEIIYGETAPHAICLAALRAVEEK